jgi:hypothetical protein
MKQRIIIFTICLFATLKMMAQEFTLQGRVMDDDNNPVELVTVSVLSQGKVAFTSLKGEFSMRLHSADSVVVKFSMIGYKSKTRVLRRPRGKQTLQIVLHADATMLGEVNVTGEKIQTDQTQEIKIKDIKMAPSASGNTVEGIIQQQAGVSTHSELSSQYNVRGGAFDENSVYINNVEVYRPFLVRSGQQEGLSVINPYMVDKIGFSTGGYGAKYGDKMSSALDITYKTLKAKGKKPVVRTPLGDCIPPGGTLSDDFHFTILRNLYDAGWLVRLVLLATSPAYVIHGIQNLFGNVTVVLGCRLATNIGTRAHDRLLETGDLL